MSRRLWMFGLLLAIAVCSAAAIYWAPFMRLEEKTSGTAASAIQVTKDEREQKPTKRVLPGRPSDDVISAKDALRISADATALVLCSGEGKDFDLIGPMLAKDPDIRFSIIANAGTPKEQVFYWATERAANPELPTNSLARFSYRTPYVISASHELVLLCGKYLEKVFRCGNGIVEGRQDIPALNIQHPAEQCDGGEGCTTTCKKA